MRIHPDDANVAVHGRRARYRSHGQRMVATECKRDFSLRNLGLDSAREIFAHFGHVARILEFADMHVARRRLELLKVGKQLFNRYVPAQALELLGETGCARN